MKISTFFNQIFNVIWARTYWPLCRTYARYLGDKPADSIYRFLCSFQFYKTHHFWPNLKNPSSFTEKLFRRMLCDRNPILTIISDKLLVRKYVADKIGNDFLIPLLWHGVDPELIPFDRLPSRFVLKTNHGCGYIILVKDKKKLNITEAKNILRNWLEENFCLNTYIGSEWAYKNINPQIIVETFIGDGENPPVDYKFYCFHGRVEFLTVHYGRFTGHKTRSFNRNFKPYDFKYDFEQWEGYVEIPTNFNKMVEISEDLSRDFDFMRVDLYNINGRIYFGELTPYPGGVSTKFLPRYRDFYLGNLW